MVQSALEISPDLLSLAVLCAPVRVRVLCVLACGSRSRQAINEALGYPVDSIALCGDLTKLKDSGLIGKHWSGGRGGCVTWYVTKKGRKWLLSEIERGRAMLFPGVPEK